MNNLDLIADWLDDTLSREGLDRGLREFAAWARDLSRLEREIVRTATIPVVRAHVPLGILGEMREAARRLVNAALRLRWPTDRIEPNSGRGIRIA
jgi:hypothetical protein